MKDKDPIIQLRGQELLKRLSVQGWHLFAIESSNLDWWVSEVWVIESEWSPKGFYLYLAFLVDPMNDSQVWSLAVLSNYPSDIAAISERPLFRLRNVWEKELPDLLKEIAALRSQAAELDQARSN
jgi:hypothetical protein